MKIKVLNDLGEVIDFGKIKCYNSDGTVTVVLDCGITAVVNEDKIVRL